MRATGRRSHSLLLVSTLLACTAILSACYGAGTTGGSYGRDWRFSNSGLVVEFAPAVDRITWFGPHNGPNMLFVTGEHRDVDPNRPVPGAGAAPSSSSYTFFGGCLTWVAPQAGPHGWKDAGGTPAPWPPDPAMDTGPCYRSGWSPTGFAATGPVHRSGLKETKEFVLLDRNSAELRFTLHNTTSRPIAQDEAGFARLVAAGEGRAAIFAEPRSHIVELQLTGPLVDIPARGSTQTVERWTLIRCSQPDLSVLP